MVLCIPDRITMIRYDKKLLSNGTISMATNTVERASYQLYSTKIIINIFSENKGYVESNSLL